VKGLTFLDHASANRKKVRSLATTVSRTEKGISMSTSNGTHTWPQLAEGLYSALTGRNAEITYDFRDMDVHVPSSTGENARHAHWKLNGVLKIRTQDLSESNA
jgi:hypothetical protein